MNYISLIYFPTHILNTAKLSSTARLLLDVLILHMREGDNLIYFNIGGMKFYLDFYKGILKKNIAEKTIRNAISELIKYDLIVRLNNNHYFINPKLFIKVSDAKHQDEMIKQYQKIKQKDYY